MGVYVVTGGSSGIGAKTIEFLKERGEETVNIDLRDSDIVANLATPTGRRSALNELYQRYPDGIDGIICNAGVSATCGNLKLIISLNYFGVVDLALGAYALLKKKGGRCVVTTSNTIAQGVNRMDIVDLLNNNSDEERLLGFIEQYDAHMAHDLYVATKYAMARWMRRVSSSWAANGVHINAVAPGNVATPMTEQMSDLHKAAVKAVPVPINYGQEDVLMDKSDIAKAIVFLSSEDAHGINGVIMFVDGGTDALLNTEKVY